MSPGIMATFVKNVPKYRSKIAQFGHTGQITLRETLLMVIQTQIVTIASERQKVCVSFAWTELKLTKRGQKSTPI